MANPKNIHIVPRENGWGTLRQGGQPGREMARQGQGELLIHGENGRIRVRDSYGNDPCPPNDQS